MLGKTQAEDYVLRGIMGSAFFDLGPKVRFIPAQGEALG